MRILQGILCGRGRKIFPNQVVFYNCIFGITNPAVLSSEYIEKVLQRCHEGEGSQEGQNDKLVRQFHYLLQGALDSNSANIGKHINNEKYMPIPRHHKVHYSNENNRTEIVSRLYAGILFLDKFGRGSSDVMEEEDYQDLLNVLKSRLSAASHILKHSAVLDAEVLSNIIYEVVLYHLARLDEPVFETKENHARVSVNVEAQRREYDKKVGCFSRLNADRFYALQRISETNVWAANELADLYYYGFAFQEIDGGGGNDGIYRVEINHGLAIYYYQKAADCTPPLLPACWSLGHMLWNGQGGTVEEEAQAAARKYFQYCVEEDYVPAYDSMGKIELAEGKKLLKRQRKMEASGGSLCGEDADKMYSHFKLAMEYFDYAGCNGLPYGHIHMAEILADDEVKTRILPVIRDRLHLEGSLDSKERWAAAAEYGNLWAIDRLAQVYFEEGNWKDALTLWKEASEKNYPSASLHMALYLYAPGRPCQDTLMYVTCLERASVDGSARASYELARYSIRRSMETCYKYLKIAERQNYAKYDDELYQAIRTMMNSLKSSGQRR